LPVGTRLKRCGHKFDHCPSCHQTENYDHVFKCPQRHKWRTTYLVDLEKQLKKLETAADVRQDVIRITKDWFDEDEGDPQLEAIWDQDGIDEEDEESLTNLRTAIAAQPRLTGGQFFRGFLGKEWKIKMEKFYRMQKKDPRYYYSGQTWTAKLIHFQWKAAQTAWHQRCDTLHAKGEAKASQRDLMEIQARVRELYKHQLLIGVKDRRIFDRPLE
jgi:hypothetical protein